MVTANGRPSGIATTITVMAMMIVFNSSVKNLFDPELKGFSSSHPWITPLASFSGASQVTRFLHPQLMTPMSSRLSLIKMAIKVRAAQA